MPQTITERFAYQGGKVDRTGPRPIIRGVLLCGPTSANRRRYKKEAFAGDRVKVYADRPVYLNHGDGRSSRSYENQVGWVRDPRLNAAGMPVGDIEVKPKHPLAEQLLDDAEHDPRAVGMSHVAHCSTSRAADGWDEVSHIERVESVDIVLDPATTKGFFEGITTRDTAVTTLRKLIESIIGAPGAKRRARIIALRLQEDADTMGLMDAPAMDTGSITDAIVAACMAIVKQMLADPSQIASGLSKIRKMANTHKLVTDDPGTDDDDAGDDADALTGESQNIRLDPAEFAKRFLETGNGMRLNAQFDAEQKRQRELRERQSGRTPPATVPTSAKEFAASIRY